MCAASKKAINADRWTVGLLGWRDGRSYWFSSDCGLLRVPRRESKTEGEVCHDFPKRPGPISKATSYVAASVRFPLLTWYDGVRELLSHIADKNFRGLAYRTSSRFDDGERIGIAWAFDMRPAGRKPQIISRVTGFRMERECHLTTENIIITKNLVVSLPKSLTPIE